MQKYLGLVFILAGSVSLAQPQTPAKPKDYTAHVVGYAHMDMAWLWR